MKKMVCEICGSQHLKKENGVFVCQECGTEYSAEEAKLLLKEIEEQTVDNQPPTNQNLLEPKEDYSTLEMGLLTWLNYLNNIKNLFGEEFDLDFTNDEVYVNGYKKDDYLFQDELYPVKTLLEKRGKDKATPTIQRFLEFKANLEEQALLKEFNNKQSLLYKSFSAIPDRSDIDFFYSGSVGSYYCNSTERENIRNSNSFIVGTSTGVRWQAVIFPDGKRKDERKAFLDWVPNFDFTRWNYSTGYYLGPIYKVTERKAFLGLKFDKELIADSPAINRRIQELLSQNREKYKRVYLEKIEPFIDEKVQLLNESIKGMDYLNETFPMPKKYRTIQDLYNMLELVKDKRVLSRKELLDKYDTDVYREDSLKKLDNIGKSIQDLSMVVISGINLISSQLSSIQDIMSNVNANIGSINIKISNMSSSLNRISTNTFITMWNTF